MTIVPGQGRHMRGSVVTCRCGVAKADVIEKRLAEIQKDLR